MDSLRYLSGPERGRRGGWREEGMQAGGRKTNKKKEKKGSTGGRPDGWS